RRALAGRGRRARGAVPGSGRRRAHPPSALRPRSPRAALPSAWQPRSADQSAALAHRDEVDERLELGLAVGELAQLLDGRGERQIAAVQDAIRIAQVADLLGREAAALESLAVDRVRLGG